jgi:hypothetical protein
MSSIKCGKCSGTHFSVDQVRECYAGVSLGINLGGAKVAYAEAQPLTANVQSARAEAPRQTPSQASVSATIPAGRYAVENNGKVHFYRIDRPTEGRWSGYVFVKEQAGDDLFQVRSRQQRDHILALIADAGVEQSSKRYGKEIGACGVCGRTLTDEHSREMGIGPICAAKQGW